MKLLLISSLFISLAVVPVQAKQNRSYHAIKQFKLENPCPASGRYKGRCEGYVIDHVIPLACGGIVTPKNMQWQLVKMLRLKIDGNVWGVKTNYVHTLLFNFNKRNKT